MIDYSPEVQNLPWLLRRKVVPYYKIEDHGSVAQLLADHFDAGKKRTVPALLVLACAEFMEAMEVMVDRVIPKSRFALSLLDEAEKVGGSSDRIDTLRSSIKPILADECARQAEEAEETEEAIESGDLTPERLSTAAHKCWDSGKQKEAAELFLQAARLEAEIAASRHKSAAPDRSINHIVRAGKCLFEAADFEAAMPLLEQAVVFDWRAGRLWGDRHTVQWAFGAMLEEKATAGDWISFDAVWKRAISRCNELEMEFPSIHPIQECLLETCLNEQKTEYLSTLVQRIEGRNSAIPSSIRDLVKQAKKAIPN